MAKLNQASDVVCRKNIGLPAGEKKKILVPHRKERERYERTSPARRCSRFQPKVADFLAGVSTLPLMEMDSTPETVSFARLES